MTITTKQVLGLLGFLFVAAWIGFNFCDAILCLVGALVFYLIGGVLEGAVDLGEMQSRFRRSQAARR
jgi:hypothetical protein